jgi:hypothetical protein
VFCGHNIFEAKRREQAPADRVDCGLLCPPAMRTLSWLTIFYLLSACDGLMLGLSAGDVSPGTAPARSSTAVPPEPDKPPMAEAPCVDAPPLVPMPMMRLTSAQYRRSVSAVLGVPVTLPSMPADPVGRFWSTSSQTYFSRDEVVSWTVEARRLADTADIERLAACQSADDECVSAFIARVGRQMMRRPLAASDTQRLRRVYDGVRSASNHVTALRAVLEVVLQSPRVLYQVDADGETFDDYTRIQRLSFALWNRAPDEALLTLASQGTLSSPGAVDRLARSMVRDERAFETLRLFHRQWMRADDVAELRKLPSTYPAFTPAVAAALSASYDATLEDIMSEGGGRFEDLFTWSATWVSAPMKPYIGVDVPATGGPFRIAVDMERTAGLLTSPAVMASLATQSNSSPIVRGNFIFSQVLCGTTGSPSGQILPSTFDDEVKPMRQRVEQHTSSPACASCHVKMDPPGFALENYDGMGAWRTVDLGFPVDSSGGLAGTDADYTAAGAGALGRAIAKSRQARRCYVKTWIDALSGFAAMTSPQACEVSDLERALGRGGIRELLVAAVSRPAFLSQPDSH